MKDQRALGKVCSYLKRVQVENSNCIQENHGGIDNDKGLLVQSQWTVTLRDRRVIIVIVVTVCFMHQNAVE